MGAAASKVADRDLPHALELEILKCFQRILAPEGGQQLANPAESYLLGTVCNMIAISFEAYKYPSEFVEDPGVKEKTRDGTEVCYVNKAGLNRCVEGVVKIQLHSGKDVKDTKRFAFSGKTNPYVVFSYGVSSDKSKTVENSLDPIWHSTHYLYVKRSSIITENADKLVIDLYDNITQDRLGICEAICSPFDRQVHTGRAIIPLEELKQPGVTEREIVIEEKKSRKCGTQPILKLSTQFLTVDEYCKEVGKDDNSHWLDKHFVENKTRSWSNLFKKANILPSLAEPFAYFDSNSSGTNAWLHVYEGIKTVVVAFRGTEVGEFADIISDIDIRPEPLSKLYKTPYTIAPNLAYRENGNFIHGGFLRAYKAVHETILDTIYSITGWDEEWAILVTGHSLGGALAVLGAYDFTNRRKEDGKGPQVGMMNVGAPRIGNRRFIRSYNSTVCPSFRVVNDRDTVPTIPHLYFHVNTEIEVNPDGRLLIGDALLQAGMDRIQFREYIAEEKYRRKNLSKRISVHTVKGALAAEYHRQPYYFEVVQSAVIDFFTKKSKSGKTALEGGPSTETSHNQPTT